MSALYFATRSDLLGAPVLIMPVARATTAVVSVDRSVYTESLYAPTSAIVVSSVSPDRCETMTPQPSAMAICEALIDSAAETR